MLHTLTRAFLIPLLALTGLAVLWLAMSPPVAQAHANQSTALVSTVDQEIDHGRKPGSYLHATLLDRAVNTATAQLNPSVTYTIHPLPRHKLQGLLSGQNQLVGKQGASIFFTKTVSTEIDNCFASNGRQVVVEPSTMITYCFIAVNTGSVTLTHHTIVDENLGTLIENLAYTLTPFGTEDNAAFIPITTLITKTVASNAVWTAQANPLTVSASDATLVIVPTIDIDSSVVANSINCSGGKKSLRVAPNTPLLYCYALKNTSPITLPIQTVLDSQLGLLADNLHHPLPAGGTFTITHTVAAIDSGTSVVTWTSATEEGVAVTASDIVTVQVPASIELIAGASIGGDACSGSTTLTVTYGTNVIFCYLIRNKGALPLQQHHITDDINGTEIFTRVVDVDRLLGVTLTTEITRSIVNHVKWEAANINGDATIENAIVTIAMTPTTIAELFLYRDNNRNNQPDPGEAGIPQVNIVLTSPSGTTFSDTTNAAGIALFAPLPEAGNYTIDIDSATLPAGAVPGQSLGNLNLVKDRHTIHAIGYQVEDAEQKIYLPMITK